MTIAVVIPTVGRTFFVLNMVMLLQAGSRKPDQIIIVDQTEPELRNRFAFAKLRECEERGLCRIIEHPVKSATIARNLGALASHADVLVYVDDDAFIPPDFIEGYIEVFQDLQIDAATGLVLVGESDDGTIDTDRMHPSRHDNHLMLRGGNFAIRRSVMHMIGGLDENMIGAANHEDADMAYRLHEHGCKVVWVPKPWIFHLSYQGGGGRVPNPRARLNFAYNLIYFHLRHGRLNAASLAGLLRKCVFNRRNVTRPWLLLPRLADFIRGYRLACAAVKRGPALPLEPLAP